jgi:hypothetical protein
MADTEVPHGDDWILVCAIMSVGRLTAEVERGQIKCHRYWESGKYGPFEVKAYSEKHINIECAIMSVGRLRAASRGIDRSALGFDIDVLFRIGLYLSPCGTSVSAIRHSPSSHFGISPSSSILTGPTLGGRY